MPGKSIGYIRVSTVDQNTERQLTDVQLDKVFEDKVSGSTIDRPQLKACLDYLRDGDDLWVHSIDRLARNLQELLNIIALLREKGVTLHFKKEGMVFLLVKSSYVSDKLYLVADRKFFSDLF